MVPQVPTVQTKSTTSQQLWTLEDPKVAAFFKKFQEEMCTAMDTSIARAKDEMKQSFEDTAIGLKEDWKKELDELKKINTMVQTQVSTVESQQTKIKDNLATTKAH